MLGQAQSLAMTNFGFTDNTTASELSDFNSASAKPMTQFINQLQAEFSKMNQFNDPQGLYTLCITCSAH